MTDEMIALARRAVTCRGWRWMPGMRVEWVGMGTGWRMLSETQSWYEREGCEDGEPGGPNAVPDLTDHATLGCLLALVREAWACECACVLPLDYGPGGAWWVCRLAGNGRSLTERHWPTEAEALVAALEAAPGQ